MAHDVFLSYSSLDKTYADNVCSIFEQNGIICWIAPRDITPGLGFAEAIIDGIKSSKVFVLVYSSNSNISTQVIREVDRAVHIGLPVINLRLEDVPLSKQLEYYLSSVHWYDAMTPPLDEHINKLSGVVKILLRKDDAKDDDLEKVIRDGILMVGKGKRASLAAEKNPRKKATVAMATLALILIAVIFLLPVVKNKLPVNLTYTDKSIAVLPFTNLSNDPEQDYFSDGMMDEILDRLFKIGDLKVISRTSSMRYKNSDLSLKEIARELDVSAILEGSVRKAGNLVRITVQLIDVRTDAHLWSETYDGDLSDLSRIFIIQSEVALSVARELKALLSPRELKLIEKVPTKSTEAYDACLKGDFYWKKLTQNDLETALKYYELAKEKDPEYAPAYAGIGGVWIGRQQMGLISPSEALPRAKEALMKAFALDSTAVDLSGYYTWSLWDWEKGEKEFIRVIERNPNDASSKAVYSHLLAILGRNEEALRQIEIAVDLDPLNEFIKVFYGVVLTFVRKYDEAIEAFQDALKIEPDYPFAQSNLGVALALSGRYKDAVEQWKLCNAGDNELVNALEKGYNEGGYKGALLSYNKVAELRYKNSYWSPTDIATNYALAGDNDKALYWLEAGYQIHEPNMPYLLIPVYDNLRDDPRFKDLCKRMKLPFK
jgi:TolB-like protein